MPKLIPLYVALDPETMSKIDRLGHHDRLSRQDVVRRVLPAGLDVFLAGAASNDTPEPDDALERDRALARVMDGAPLHDARAEARARKEAERERMRQAHLALAQANLAEARARVGETYGPARDRALARVLAAEARVVRWSISSDGA